MQGSTRSARRSLLTRILEGEHPWGSVQIGSSDRWGWQQLRLTVYPPGTNSTESRKLAFLRNWPLVGALLCLVLMMTLGSVLSPVAVGISLVAIWVAGVIAGFQLTRRTRAEVRHASAVIIFVNGRRDVMGDYKLICDARDDFAGLDESLASGEITPVEYESGWAKIYGRFTGAPGDSGISGISGLSGDSAL
jgi:hypothetical protein